jgi:D-alanyl-D-alanine carboxypeptidase/D-alanyl-D-alanine-endopeptidase (penicillin-binding protein 4)
MRRPLTAAVILTLVFASCAARAQRSPRAAARTTTAALERLHRDLRALFTAESLDHAHWAVNVRSLGSGETIYAQDALKLMVPASSQKLLTAAVAADRLGWDYRFTTRILATGPIEGGILDGDLIVVGNGDPSINPRHAERWGAFDNWGTALAAKGIRAVNGRVIGDDNAVEEPGWGIGWAWDDLQYGYGAAAAALQYNENQIEITIGPGLAPGATAIVTTSPAGHGMFVVISAITVARDAETRVGIGRLPASNRLQVAGEIAAGSKPVTLTAAVPNPTALYVIALREALGRQGVFVSGGMADIDDVKPAPDTSKATELLVDYSPPLFEIIDVTLKWSRNEYAETLLRAVAPPDEPASDRAGLEVMREQLRTVGIMPELYIARDGSGLSRMNLVSAEAMTSLLTYMWMDPRHNEMFRSTLPVAGVSGTLAERMKDTPAQNRVWAKTGTMSNVRALAGYLVTEAGEPMVFAILVNNYRVLTAEIDATIDKALIRLVQFQR